MPAKRKKKQDISVVIEREKKKRRKLEKSIKKLQAKGRKFKPIDEIEGFRDVKKTLE